MEGLVRKYRAIGPLLTKMEGLIAHTNTGKSPKMHSYYAYWESRVYDALLKVWSLLNISVIKYQREADLLIFTSLGAPHILFFVEND